MGTRTVPSALQDHLNGKVTTLAQCWKITRRDGEVYTFTDCDRDIPFDGYIYKAINSGSSSAFEQTNDGSPSNMEITTILDHADISEEDLENGLFDSAEVKIFILNYLAPEQGALKVVNGEFGEVEIHDEVARVEFRSLSQRLLQKIGRLYTNSCDVEELGDSRCGINIAEWTVQGAVKTVNSNASFGDTLETWTLDSSTQDPEGDYLTISGDKTSILSPGHRLEVYDTSTIDGAYTVASASFDGSYTHVVVEEEIAADVIGGSVDFGYRTEEDGWFAFGNLTWLSGDNAGLSNEVKGYAGGTFSLLFPTAYPIQHGDQYQVYAGCDRFKDTCRDKFNNLDNFRGFDLIPGRDEAMRYPDAH